ncbi:MAG: YfiT family bacillithiol transferase [Flavisolibacter sp.]
MIESTDLRYPIGKYITQPFSAQQKEEWLAAIKFLPDELEAAIQSLDEQQLQTPYRPGGWTINQVVHHLADSHMNAYIRFKLGYAEDNPTIKPYDENIWAQMEDVKALPVNISTTLLFALHKRWFAFLQSLTNEQWQRTVFHPEHNKQMTLWFLLGMYAWHGRHHVAHITSLKEREKW